MTPAAVPEAAPPKTTEDPPAAPPSGAGSVLEGIEDLLKEDDDELVVTPPAKVEAPVAASKAEPPAPVASVKPTIAAPVAPTPLAAAPAPPVVPAAAAPAVQPPAKPVETPLPATVAQEPVAKTPEQERSEWLERRKGFVTQLATHYKVPEDKVALLEAEPAQYLPELAAELHANVLEAAVNGIMAELPRVIAGYQAAQQRYQAAEAAFFTKWPELNKPEYTEVVTQFVNTYRQLNPKATPQQTIDQVGIMAMTHLNLSAAATALSVVPAAPAAVPASPTPIVPGSGAAQMPQRPQANPWEELSREDLD